MRLYSYKAKANPEEIETGTINADNKNIALAKIRAMGLHPISITEKEKTDNAKDISSLFLKVKSRDISIFTRQLSNLIQSGFPLGKALPILITQTENQKLILVIKNLKSSIEGGDTFSKALTAYPKIFSSLYVNMVKAGESAGMLDTVLERLANFKEKEEEIIGQIKSALTYPVLLVIVGAITIFVLVTFVIPRFVTMFIDLGQVLPLPTRILIDFSNLMSKFWWLFILIIIFIIFAFRYASHKDKVRLIMDQIELKLPLLGRIFHNMEISKFSRTLGTLLLNGVPMLDSLRIVVKTITNTFMVREISFLSEGVSKGGTLSNLLRKNSIFPPVVANMIGVGEESGKLEEMLLRISDTFDRETEQRLKTMISLLEPVLILILGTIIGLIVMAMLLPIFQINILAK